MSSIEVFHDAVIELEQYRVYTETPHSRVLEQPDCAEVVERMVELVSESPEVVDFYQGALKRYRKTKPESVGAEAAVIRDRVQQLEELDVITSSQAARQYQALDSGELVYKEAKVFFRMFKSVIDPSKVPADRYHRPRKTRKPVVELVEEERQEEVVVVETEQPRPTLEPTVLVELESSEAIIDETEKELGWEYDQMVAKYKSHPDNSLRKRYARDCEGFNVADLEPFSSTKAAISGDEVALFGAYMDQFPLLDGAAHEEYLKDKVEAGKEAMLLLQQNPDLEDVEKSRLEKLAIEGAGAYLTMFECNLRLVLKFASRYPSTVGYKKSDAIQDGCFGLRRAIQKFEPEKGFKFSTYAVAWIKQSIDRRHGETFYDLRLPVHALQKAKSIRDAIIKAENAREPLSDADLLEQGYKESAIFTARHLLHLERKSLDAPVSPVSEASLEYFLKTPDVDFEGRTLSEDHSLKLFAQIIEESGLTDPRALRILALRNGVVVPGVDYNQHVQLNGYEPDTIGEFVMRVRSGEIVITLDEIAHSLDMTRERVRQIHEETSAALLRASAFVIISKRLNLDEQERKDINAYFQIKGFIKTGRPNKDKILSAHQKAKNIVGLLQLLDADFQGVLRETLSILEVERNYAEKKLKLSERWLRVRFGLDEVDEIPLGSTQARNYKVEVAKARVEESIFLAVLTGTWGSVPEKFGELNIGV